MYLYRGILKLSSHIPWYNEIKNVKIKQKYKKLTKNQKHIKYQKITTTPISNNIILIFYKNYKKHNIIFFNLKKITKKTNNYIKNIIF